MTGAALGGPWWKSTSGGRGFSEAGWCVGYSLPVLLEPRCATKIWGRALGVRVLVCVCPGGGSPSIVGERRGGSGGGGSGSEREQVNRLSPSGPGSGCPGRASRAASRQAAWAGRERPTRVGAPPASAPEVVVGGRDPPLAGTEPRSLSREVPPALAIAKGVGP